MIGTNLICGHNLPPVFKIGLIVEIKGFVSTINPILNTGGRLCPQIRFVPIMCIELPTRLINQYFWIFYNNEYTLVLGILIPLIWVSGEIVTPACWQIQTSRQRMKIKGGSRYDVWSILIKFFPNCVRINMIFDWAYIQKSLPVLWTHFQFWRLHTIKRFQIGSDPSVNLEIRL